MNRLELKGITLECLQGDIAAQQDLDAIVNAANAALLPGGGVAGAIHRAAGPGLEAECRPLAPIAPGEAVITGAHQLPNRHVIHCLGPVFGRDKPEAELLASCYRNALRVADENRLDSIGFPAISTGVFGYPPEEACKVALDTVAEVVEEPGSVKLIRFVLFDEESLELYRQGLMALSG